jgi:hypothetical protein
MLSWHWLSWFTNDLSTKIEDNHTLTSSDGQQNVKMSNIKKKENLLFASLRNGNTIHVLFGCF